MTQTDPRKVIEAEFRDRFWSRVNVGAPHECWEWTGAKNQYGYGLFQVSAKAERFTHRIAYKLEVGPIPDKMHVCHSCDNRLCANPAHLWVGPNSANMADRDAKGRQAKGEANGRAKLTASQVLTIRDDARSYVAIAADYGVGRWVIGRIKRRQLWRHI